MICFEVVIFKWLLAGIKSRRKYPNFGIQGSVINGLLAGLKVAENVRILAYMDQLLIRSLIKKVRITGWVTSVWGICTTVGPGVVPEHNHHPF